MGGGFCGIEPAGAHELLKAMAAEKEELSTLYSALRKASYQQAGADLDPAAADAATALLRYMRFLDTWWQDLTWRIRYVMATNGTTWAQHPSMLSVAAMPFGDYQEAQREGGAKGAEQGKLIREAWLRYQRDPTGQNLQALNSELAKSSEYRHEPYYAAALLGAIGGEHLRKLLDRGVPTPDATAAADVRLRQELGGLAAMFAAADRAGALPPDVRREVLRTDPTVLAAFLRLTPNHTDTFALDAAKRILDVVAVPEAKDYREWVAARRLLLKELWRRPGVAQILLSDRRYVRALLPNQIVASGQFPEYQKELSAVLWRALGQTVGDDGDRQRAWMGLIKAFAENDPSLFTGQPVQVSDLRTLLAGSPDLAEVLAVRLKPYLPYLAWSQVKDPQVSNIKDGGIPQPTGPAIAGVTAGDLGSFLGGLVRTKKGQDALVAGLAEYQKAHNPLLLLTAGQINAGKTKPEDLRAFRHALKIQAGIAGLILRGAQEGGLDFETEKQIMANLIGLTTGYLTGPLGEAGPLVDMTSKPLQDWAAEAAAGPKVDPDGLENGLKKGFARALDRRLAQLERETGRDLSDLRESALDGYDAVTENAAELAAPDKPR